MELLRRVRPLLNQTLLQTELQVCVGLVSWRDPAIPNKKAAKVPLFFTALHLVTIEDGFRDIRNMLSGVRLSSEIKLGFILSVKSNATCPVLQVHLHHRARILGK